jgi:small-conductance mechanosensitive channel
LIEGIHDAWLAAVGTLLGAVLLGVIVRALVLKRMFELARRSESDLDDLLVRGFCGHLPFWFLLGGAAIAVHIAPMREDLQEFGSRIVAAVFTVSLTWAAAVFAAGWLRHRADRSGAGQQTTTLIEFTVRGIILGLGALLVLANLGIAITPLLAALGVGSLALALAIQPTLSNYFAGIHLSLARPMRVGDFVTLENGTQGYVVDIGWRSSRIRQLSNEVVVVPNGRLVEMVLTNHDMPQPELAVLVKVGVSYSSDLERVQAVTVDVAREVLREVEGGIPEFDPIVRYTGFGESSIDFTVVLRARRFVDRYILTHEFVKRLHRRYIHEGIEIPFPQRVIHGARLPD